MKKIIELINRNIKTTVKDSVYFKWIKRNVWAIIGCLLISSFLCILTYPGILYTDSYSRIDITNSLKMALHAYSTGNAALTTLQSWTTITPSFFILLSKEITGSIVLYTFVQCFFLFFTSYCMGITITEKNHKAWNVFWIIICPVLWAYGVYYEASVACVTAIMGILLLIWKWEVLANMFDKILSILLLIFLSFICFGYRANAFTILPVLILIVILKEKNIIKSSILVGSIIIGMLLTIQIPKILNIDTMSSYAGAFIWESISTIQEMDEDKKLKYSTYFDDIFGEGITASAITRNTYKDINSSINTIWWGYPFDINEVSKEEKTKAVLYKYLSLIKNEPKTYLKVKWKFICNTLGIGQPLRMVEYDYNRNNAMGNGDYIFNNSIQRLTFVNYFIAFMSYMKIFRMPWLLFLVAMILIIIWRINFLKNKKTLNLYEATYGVALFYYGAFLLNNQSFEFRYFFPSWLLLMFIIISISTDIAFRNKYSKKTIISGFITLSLICMLGGYKEYTKKGDSLVINAKKGELLYNDNGNYVYYLDEKLYFLTDSTADTKYRYFLHYSTIDGGVINNDFTYNRNKIPSFIGNLDVVVMDIPKKSIKSLKFGQFYNNNCFWETSIDIDTFLNYPKYINVSNFSDSNWTNGYSNTEKCLLLDDVSINNYMLKGKYLLLKNDKKVKIIDVVETDGHIRICTNKKITNINNRVIQVVEE